MPDTLRFRQTVRALVLDPDDLTLLAKFVFPSGVEAWALPGGGLEDGETPEACLRRELLEELGLDDAVIGPHIWNREHIVPMYTGHDGGRDRVHLVRAPHFDPEPVIGWEAMRAELVFELRWWSLDEIATRHDLRFVPRRLPHHLRRLLADGPPSRPIDVGV